MNVNALDIAHPPVFEGSTEEARRHTYMRQNQLIARYKRDPEAAWTVDTARTLDTTPESLADPRYGSAFVGYQANVLPFGAHAGVGGPGDRLVSGDILCAALASCVDTTIRLVANRLRIGLERLSVKVDAHVDLRGTMCVDASVPVGFQTMLVEIDVSAKPGTEPNKVAMLIAAAEHCCVVLKTLRGGVPIEVKLAP